MIKFMTILLAFLYSGVAMAASATVQSLTGDVKASIGTAAPAAVTKDSALETGMTITTGDNSNIVMKFEDGQIVVLNANTTFKINRYIFNAAQPQSGNAFFSLVKGAMRSISGLIGKHNNSGFRLQTPVATIGIRGTDFMAATGSLYVSVGEGLVSATNAGATSVFSAGQLGFVAGPAVAPAAIAASQLPASVASSFSQLGSISVSGAAGATGNASGASNTGYGNTATGSTSSGASTGTTGSTGTGTAGTSTGTAGTTTAGTTAGTTASTTVAGGATATAGATGTLGVTGIAAGAAGVAAVVGLAAQQTNTSVTATVTVLP